MINERLKVAITVATSSASVEIPPGNVERVALTMTPYGVEATLVFWLKDGVALGGSLADELLTDFCLLYTSPSPRDRTRSRMPSSA